MAEDMADLAAYYTGLPPCPRWPLRARPIRLLG